MTFPGTKITFSVLFTNADGDAADPTVVRFRLVEAVDATELAWLYAASPVVVTHYPTGMNPIVKDSTGNYHVAYVTRKAERHVGYWSGAGVVDQTTQSTVFVRHTDIPSLE